MLFLARDCKLIPINTAVAELVEKALLLPAEARTDLLGAIWEQEVPLEAFVSDQMDVIWRPIANVQNGVSSLVPSDIAHQFVRESLRQAP